MRNRGSKQVLSTFNMDLIILSGKERCYKKIQIEEGGEKGSCVLKNERNEKMLPKFLT